jgi:hypothetical protein
VDNDALRFGHKTCASRKAVLYKMGSFHNPVFPVMTYEETIKEFAAKYDEGEASALLIIASDPGEFTSSSHQLGIWLRMTAGLKCGKSIFLVTLTDPLLTPLNVYTFAQMYAHGSFGTDERSLVYSEFVKHARLKGVVASGRGGGVGRTSINAGGAIGSAANAKKAASLL